MIVVDTNFLVLMIDPSSTQNENRRPDRVRHFVETISRSGQEVVIPAPVIAELVAGRADRVDEVVESLRRSRVFTVQPFDSVIAIETGEIIAAAQSRIPEHQRLPGWKQVMKFDAMIAATAIVRQASGIYTADNGFEPYLRGSQVKIMHIDKLPLPPEDPQHKLPV